MIEKFISTLFASRTQAHIYHLQTKSYAEHIAIGEFYESITDTIDSIAEMAIGLDIDVKSTPKMTLDLEFKY